MTSFPFFYVEGPLLKVRESGLPEARKTMLLAENAARLLPPKTA